MHALLPWRLQFLFNEIKSLSSSISLELKHTWWTANGFADSLAKQEVDKSSPLVAFTMFSDFLVRCGIDLLLCNMYNVLYNHIYLTDNNLQEKISEGANP